MNTDNRTEHRDARLEGQWDEVKGRVQEAWGDLTDDDVDKAQGSWDRLVGTIRQRTGESLDRIETTLSGWIDELDEAGRPEG